MIFDFKVGDYITDFEKLYYIYKQQDSFFFYRPVGQDKQLEAVTCSIPVSSIQKSGFRHLMSSAELDKLFSEMPQKFSPVALDPKSVKETIYLNDPFKTLLVYKTLFQTKKTSDHPIPKNNLELMESIHNILVAEISFVTQKPPEVITQNIDTLIGQSLAI